MITANQINTYRQDGCVIIDDFFTGDEVQALRNELYRLKDEDVGHNVNPAGQAAVNYQIIPLHNTSTLYRSLLFADKVTDALEKLLGGNAGRWLDQIFLKPAGHGSGTEWHADNAYFHCPDVNKGLGLWIALHDATPDNGTMEVIPRSHTWENMDYRASKGSDHHITVADDFDESDKVHVTVPAGGCVFFNFGILHCTRGNNTSSDRAGLAYHFNREDNFPNTQKDVYVPIIGEHTTGGEKEYGTRITGTWESEVAQALSHDRSNTTLAKHPVIT